MPLSRRRFFALIAGVTAAGTGVYGWWRGRRPEPQTAMITADAAFLAVIDTIVPDDQDPGAVSAGVPAALRQNFKREPWREKEYRQVVQAVTSVANTRHGRPFAALDLDARTEILHRLLRDKEAGDARVYLALLRVAVLRQFYSSPAGQRMLGYTPPRHGYSNYHLPPV